MFVQQPINNGNLPELQTQIPAVQLAYNPIMGFELNGAQPQQFTFTAPEEAASEEEVELEDLEKTTREAELKKEKKKKFGLCC